MGNAVSVMVIDDEPLMRITVQDALVLKATRSSLLKPEEGLTLLRRTGQTWSSRI
jgi:hypothetical protein